MAPAPIQSGSFLSAAFQTLLDAADDGLLVFDGGGACALVGRAIGELFDVKPAELVGRPRSVVLTQIAQCCEEPESFLDLVAPDDRREPVRTIANVQVRRPKPRSVTWTSVPITVAGINAASGRLILIRDVTRERSAERSLKQLQARVQELTPVDPLTGLFNQRRFREDLDREHNRSTRAWDSYALLLADVDGMHAINDEFGFPVGDEVLEKVATLIKSSKREYDVVARRDTDCFVVLLPGADALAAYTVASRMMKAVAHHSFDLEARGPVHLSIGGAVWVPPSAEGPDNLLQRAEEHLATAQIIGGRLIIDGVEKTEDGA